MDSERIIPRVIHYCWFGGSPLPASALRCIESWKKFCPEYEIKRWDETNYDVNSCRYTKEAYEARKWAFVSDYARFDILHTYGGVYFDTDVELLCPIEDILNQGPFLGMEQNVGNKALVAPGLGMAAPKGLPFYGKILENYRKMHFLNEDGSYNQTTIVKYTTDMLLQEGLTDSDEIQQVAGIWIYPWDYFCPMKYPTGEMTVTANTRSIHHYDSSWLSEEDMKVRRFTTKMCQRFGPVTGMRISWIYDFQYRVRRKISQKGFWGAVRFVFEKIRKRC